MADVQLEKGYTRIANRLLEAVLDSTFSDRQVRLVMALIRLTYGWRRNSVVMTTADWALAAGFSKRHIRAPGNVRADMDELITHGVVLSDRRQGMRRATFGIQKDFARWGRFSVEEDRLRSLWSDRPNSNDVETSHLASTKAMSDTLKRTNHTLPELGPSQGQVTAVAHPTQNRGTWPPYGPTDAKTTWPGGGPSLGPVEGQVTPRKSSIDETLQSWKDRKTVVSTKNTDPKTGAGIARDALESPPQSPAPLLNEKEPDPRDRFLRSQRADARADWRSELAAMEARYGAELVTRACLDCLMALKPVSTPGVFRIFCANAAKDTAKPDAAAPARTSEQRAFDAAGIQRGREQANAYSLARRAAGERWAADPANAAEFALIRAEAVTWLGLAATMPNGPANVERRAFEVAGDRSGFPNFAAWVQSQSSESS